MAQKSKEELIRYAEFCHEKAIQANQFWLLIQQIRALYHSDLYQKEMDVSPYFYTVMLNALNNALVIKLAKLYDGNTKSTRLKALLEMIRANIMLFPEEWEVPVNELLCYKIPLCPASECNELLKRLKKQGQFQRDYISSE